MSRRFSRRKFWVTSTSSLLLLSLAVIIGPAQQWLPVVGRAVRNDQPGLYTINHYIDGDTVAVNMNGRVESVRFIGIDTPETHKPNTPVQCYGLAAAAHTKQVISTAGGKVRLVADPLSTDRDRYGRLLRYVDLPDGTSVNELNIRQGYAFYYPYFPFSKTRQFAADQLAAQRSQLGLWVHCTPTHSDEGGYKMDETLSQQK